MLNACVKKLPLLYLLLEYKLYLVDGFGTI